MKQIVFIVLLQITVLSPLPARAQISSNCQKSIRQHILNDKPFSKASCKAAYISLIGFCKDEIRSFYYDGSPRLRPACVEVWHEIGM